MSESKKQLVYNIIDFIRTCETDGSVKEDDKESLEVAVQCLAEAFSLDPDSPGDKSKYTISPASLSSIFDVFLKTKTKASTSSAKSSAIPATGAEASPPTKEHEKDVKEEEKGNVSEEDKKKAEALKAEGNALHTKKLYSLAIAKYTSAIALDPHNPVYWSNRSAAYSADGDYENAKKDARRSVDVDQGFVRGWSRLGHAEYALGNFTASIAAYTQGLTLDPTSANMKTALAQAKLKAKEFGQPEVAKANGGANDSEDEDEDEDAEEGGASVSASRGAGAPGGPGGMPDLAGLASMLGGMGGGGRGGMPDLASLMQNPAMMQMAQNMMANGGLDRLMENPMMRNMAERMQSGGGMPDLAAMANDPAMRDMAQQFMGGQGR